MRAPPLAQNFFIFMQFVEKIGQIIGWRPPLGLAPPPLGNPGSVTGHSHRHEVTRGHNGIKGCKTHFLVCNMLLNLEKTVSIVDTFVKLIRTFILSSSAFTNFSFTNILPLELCRPFDLPNGVEWDTAILLPLLLEGITRLLQLSSHVMRDLFLLVATEQPVRLTLKNYQHFGMRFPSQ